MSCRWVCVRLPVVSLQTNFVHPCVSFALPESCRGVAVALATASALFTPLAGCRASPVKDTAP